MKKEYLIAAVILAVVFLAASYITKPGTEPMDQPSQGDLSEQPQAPEQEPPQDTSPDDPVMVRGVSVSPRSAEGQDFVDFFVKAEFTGGIVTWAGDWGQLTEEEGAPVVITELCLMYDLEPIVIATYFHQSTGKLAVTLNETVRMEYIESAAGYAEKYRPRYMGFGIEVNSFAMRNPEGYDEFVEFFGEAYAAVKEASPDTKVFTVFQLERMKGMWGGLFGESNDPDLAQWAFLDDFQKADALAFTTYPCLIFREPSEIPKDYYVELRNRTSKEVLFVEIGWFREGPEGWESDEAEQAEFIESFLNLTSELNPSVTVWSFMYDQEAQYPFDTMGLIDTDETQMAAWEAWTGVPFE